METAQLPFHEQQSHNLFDIGIGQVMSEINQGIRLTSQFAGKEERLPPVANCSGIKVRLKRFVLHKDFPVVRQCFVNFLQAFQRVFKSTSEIQLSGETRSVSQPYGERFGSQFDTVLDHVDIMVDSLLADSLIYVLHRPELVAKRLSRLVLKR